VTPRRRDVIPPGNLKTGVPQFRDDPQRQLIDIATPCF